MTELYQPGDTIVKDGPRITRTRRYVVADPPRTARGKLRLLNESGGITTTWWGGGWLPPHYRLLERSEMDDRVLSPAEVQRMMDPMDSKDRGEAFKDLAKSHEMLRARMLEAEVEARGCQSDVRQLAELREVLTKPIGKVTLGGESGVVYEASLVKKATKTRSLEGRSLS